MVEQECGWTRLWLARIRENLKVATILSACCKLPELAGWMWPVKLSLQERMFPQLVVC